MVVLAILRARNFSPQIQEFSTRFFPWCQYWAMWYQTGRKIGKERGSIFFCI